MTRDDRGDLDREEAIARALRRRAPDVPIPPFGAVQSRVARRAPLAFVVAAATALIVVALVVGGLLADRRAAVAEPQATPPSSAASPAATATASTSADATVLSNRFGFVWAPQSGPAGVKVQSEVGPGGFELPTQGPWSFSACGCAVSPDGTRMAYWAGSTPGNVELRVVEVARREQATVIYKPPADRRWSALVWSSDGNGILFSLEDWGRPGGPVGGPSGTSLLVIDATGGTARTLASGDGAYVPLGWDRASGIAAAALSGEGGYMTGYLTVRTSGDPAPQRTAMPEQIGVLSVRVSADQRFVLGVFSTGQVNTVRWWKLDAPGAMATAPRVPQNVQPTWRPLTNQIAWVENSMLQLLDVERGVTSTGGSLPAGDYPTLSFRVDGSAVAANSFVLLDIASGRSAPLASLGYIVGSVRFNSPPLAQPSFPPEGSPPPLNEREVRVIGALAKLGITGQRGQLPYTGASIVATLGTGSYLQVGAYELGTADRNYAVIDERRVAGIVVQHLKLPSSDTIRIRFECSADEYWVFGAVPPGIPSLDAFVERFISVLGCSA